jgi:hypothetical protein
MCCPFTLWTADDVCHLFFFFRYTVLIQGVEDYVRQYNGQKKKDRQYNGQKKKDSQYNDQKKKVKRTNNDLQNTTLKTKK